MNRQHQWQRFGRSPLVGAMASVGLGVALLLSGGCDRRDNQWNAFDPELKVMTVTTDTLRLAEGGAASVVTVALLMVPEDTVRVVLSAVDGQVTARPDTLIFPPIDDDWARRQTTEITALDDEVDEGDHGDALTVLAESHDAEFAGQGGTGLVPVLVTDNDRAGVSITETALAIVESSQGALSETYRMKLLSRPMSDVTVTAAAAPTDPTFHLEPASLVFTTGNWDQEQAVRVWADIDQDDADDQFFTISHTAASSDPNYGPGTAIADVAVAVYDDTLPPIARVRLTTGATGILDEGVPGATVDVTVSLDHPSTLPVTLHLATVDGTAVAGVDYLGLDQDVIFSPGTPLTRNFALSAVDDAFLEEIEEFDLVLTGVANAIIGDDDRLTVAIADDDWTTLTLTVSDVDEDTGAADFVVSMPQAESIAVGFTFVTTAGTATAGDDFEPLNEAFIIEPGQTQRVIPVVLLADPDHEPNETFTGHLIQLTDNAVWGGSPVACTIRNDDPQAVTLVDITVDEAAGNAVFTVQLQAPYNAPVNLTVTILTGDGLGSSGGQEDAAAGSDFTGSVTAGWIVPAHALSATYSVPITADTQAERLEEYFRLRIDAGSEPGFAGLMAQATIIDDDQPTIVVDDVSVLESATTVLFVARLVDGAGQPVTSTADVAFRATTLDQTATTPDDYTALDQIFTIAAGAPAVDVEVSVHDDVHDDDGETFVLHLGEAVNGIIDIDAADPFCAVTDDEFPSINLAAVLDRANEGTTVVFTVSLTTPRQAPSTYELTLLPGTSQGETVDYDFSALSAQTIPPFTSSVSFDVPFLDDQLAGESDEVLQAIIANANVALGVTSLALTIVDAPELTVADAAALEGDDVSFPVTLAAVSTADITFRVQFSSDTANVGADIDGSATGPFTIPAGSPGTVVPVPAIAGDGGDQETEQFTVTLINPTNATLSPFNSATGTITDGDPPPLAFAGPAAAVEGDAVLFTVELGWTSEAAIQFYLQFTDGTAAGAGIDYDDTVTGPYTVSAGASSAVVAVPTVADGGPEAAAEDFTATLLNPTNAVIGAAASAVGQVLDGDQPLLSIPLGDTAVEGGTLAFTVHLDRQTVVPVFFDLIYLDGSTQGAGDFTPTAGPFSMMPGTTDTTITVSTVDDPVHENQEIFVLRLADDPTNAVAGVPAQANGIIDDDDP